MARVLFISLILLSLASCKEEKKYYMEIEGAEAGIVEGDIRKVHLYHGSEDNEILEDARIIPGNPGVASTRHTPEDMKENIKGYYLLAHRPGTTTLTAVKKGDNVAAIEVTVIEQQ